MLNAFSLKIRPLAKKGNYLYEMAHQNKTMFLLF